MMGSVQLILNRYRIGALLREGELGTVFCGTGTQTDHPIAINQLGPELAVKNPDLVPRFVRPHRLGIIPRVHRATAPSVV